MRTFAALVGLLFATLLFLGAVLPTRAAPANIGVTSPFSQIDLG